MLNLVTGESLTALRTATLAPLPVAPAPTVTASVVRKPSRGWRIRQWFRNLRNGSFFVPLYARLARKMGLAVAYASLYGRVIHADGSVTDYGLLSRRVVTDAGVAFMAGMLDGTNTATVFKFAGFGTGTNAEAQTDTALQTELTTQYASANTRPTGSQAHGTGTHSGTYTTVATLTPSANVTITEHGIFSVATSGSGTLWDRSVFSGIALVAANPDSLQATYVLSLPSGG